MGSKGPLLCPNSLPLVPDLSYEDLVHTLKSYSLRSILGLVKYYPPIYSKIFELVFSFWVSSCNFVFCIFRDPLTKKSHRSKCLCIDGP
jgi:hypothetical protein